MSFGPTKNIATSRRAEPVGEHLGVAEELEAAAPRPRLRDRRGDERGELAALRRRDRGLEVADLRRAATLVGRAGHRAVAGAVADDLDVGQRDAERARAALERHAIAVDDAARRASPACAAASVAATISGPIPAGSPSVMPSVVTLFTPRRYHLLAVAGFVHP